MRMENCDISSLSYVTRTHPPFGGSQRLFTTRSPKKINHAFKQNFSRFSQTQTRSTFFVFFIVFLTTTTAHGSSSSEISLHNNGDAETLTVVRNWTQICEHLCRWVEEFFPSFGKKIDFFIFSQLEPFRPRLRAWLQVSSDSSRRSKWLRWGNGGVQFSKWASWGIMWNFVWQRFRCVKRKKSLKEWKSWQQMWPKTLKEV